MKDDINLTLGKLLEKTEVISDECKHIKEVMERNTISLEQHEYRTTLAEENLKSLREEFESEIGPIKEHVDNIKGFGRGLRWVGWIAGALLAVIGLYNALF